MVSRARSSYRQLISDPKKETDQYQSYSHIIRLGTVLVIATDPGLGFAVTPTQGGQIQKGIRPVVEFSITRVRVIHPSILTLHKNVNTRQVFRHLARILLLVVIRDLLRSVLKRNAVVLVERVVFENRVPLEVPPEALLVRFNLIDRRTRDEDEAGVTSLGEVRVDTPEAVGEERAVRTSKFGLRTEHEVIHDKLLLAVE